MTFFLSFLRTDLPISHRDFFLPIYYSYLHVCVCLCTCLYLCVYVCMCVYLYMCVNMQIYLSLYNATGRYVFKAEHLILDN